MPFGEEEKSEDWRKGANRSIFFITCFFSFLFFGLIAYIAWFIYFEAPGRMGNPYNARMEVFDSRYLRGKIISSDGEILAETEVDANGKETRVYPFGEAFAHVLGYSTRGKTGLESLANFYLMESSSNPFSIFLDELRERKSQGDNVTCTLDSGLQIAAKNALGERAGAVVCMEPSTGRVLAMVSFPGFDPNTVSREWEDLTSPDNHSGNLLNRATQGLYPPGSTFKTVMALEYFREHPGNPEAFHFVCDGEYREGSRQDYVVHCYSGESHGEEDLGKAYAYSCNAAFAYLGTKTDPEKLRELSDSLFFNEELPIALPSAKSSMPVSKDTGTWLMMQSAIGQGEILVSPMHNLLITSAIANDGVLREPVFLEKVSSPAGMTVKPFTAGRPRRLMRAEEAELLKNFMRRVVTDGTGSGFRNAEYSACGKTGSAEYMKRGEKKTDAWFTGFAPADEPTIAITVLVEDGDTGGRTAVPIAREVVDYWMSRKAQ